MLFLLDNYDSFTYNLYQYLGELGQQVVVRRNDKTSIDEIRKLAPARILISPGPRRPEDAGLSIEIIKVFAGVVPIMGVCLGHQAICQAFGGEIIRNYRLMHGKTSPIHHDGAGLFRDLDLPFEATRYHSLIANRANLPDCFDISAWTDEDEIMGIRHKELPVEGVQFHPESILTVSGKDILSNFISSDYPGNFMNNGERS